MTTRIKICGITRLEDAILAIELGADAIGLNFFAGPRRVDPEVARTIHRALRIDAPANARPVQIVVLCAGSRRHFPDSLAWHEIASIFPPPDVYQIYADDYRALSGAQPLEGKWWMVARVTNRAAITAAAAVSSKLAPPPAAILLDTATEKHGGSGESFDWRWIAQARDSGELDRAAPLILAGGLTPENVAEAIAIARPHAVDVASGVEVPGKPGVKDRIKLRDFIQAALARRASARPRGED